MKVALKKKNQWPRQTLQENTPWINTEDKRPSRAVFSF